MYPTEERKSPSSREEKQRRHYSKKDARDPRNLNLRVTKGTTGDTLSGLNKMLRGREKENRTPLEGPGDSGGPYSDLD